jgi:hypothetical protein
MYKISYIAVVVYGTIIQYHMSSHFNQRSRLHYNNGSFTHYCPLDIFAVGCIVVPKIHLTPLQFSFGSISSIETIISSLTLKLLFLENTE